jgi:hypothetical protein
MIYTILIEIVIVDIMQWMPLKLDLLPAITI